LRFALCTGPAARFLKANLYTMTLSLTSSFSFPQGKVVEIKPSSDLSRAAAQSGDVQKTMEQSASELTMISAVLHQDLPDAVQRGEVRLALNKTDQAEARLHEAAAELAQVNQILEKEVREHARLEAELHAARAQVSAAN
jgi:C4-dicarboxylate-specific signal transduction histidine kinase